MPTTLSRTHQKHVFFFVVAKQLQSLRFPYAAHREDFAVAGRQSRVPLRLRLLVGPPVQARHFQQVVVLAPCRRAVEIGQPTATRSCMGK